MRADVYLTEHGFFESRSKAAAAIKGGFIKADGVFVDKPSSDIANGAVIVVSDGVCPYVSRGGLKLRAALDCFKIDAAGLCAVDIGSSTGGFTDCLLKAGAAHVTAVDSGTAQLHVTLRNDRRVTVLENFNARGLSPENAGMFDIAVADVSFISQTFIIPAAASVLKDGAAYVGLIKPQFETERRCLGKNGIVKDKSVRAAAIRRVLEASRLAGLVPLGLTVSPVAGGDGNIEFLFYAVKTFYTKKGAPGDGPVDDCMIDCAVNETKAR